MADFHTAPQSCTSLCLFLCTAPLAVPTPFIRRRHSLLRPSLCCGAVHRCLRRHLSILRFMHQRCLS
ncbi:hypothetical protein PVAP13_2NG180403 [Panicum virgatum]|uniref:Secreted protein n=1 Tax=Panicum virgatum TaxID=38727 RepID=A0A8T0VPV2_PANVG|nr:hypothetical protein PVAP13_2NG180403 [Panicum virgatum]